jgi:N-acetylmuramate 1-kinase
MEGIDPFLVPFLTQYFKDASYSVYSLAGDASNRRYYRVISNNQSWVLMRWEPFEPTNYPFLSVLNHFKANEVHVPEVVSMDAGQGLVLLEDLGDLTLERKFWESQNQENSLPFYKAAIDELIKIHFVSTQNKGQCTAFNIMFDIEKFNWELNYAYEHLLKGILEVRLSEKDEKQLKSIFNDISTKLHNEPKFISHRDYHSRNLMLKLDKIRVIDFQDARLGPIQYDLVSLLKDSYVDLNSDVSSKLLKYYLEKASPFLKQNIDLEQFDYIYELQSIQRCFKACGSFASFYMMRNDKRYLKYLSGTLKTVAKSLTPFSEYTFMMDVMSSSGAFERNYEAL